LISFNKTNYSGVEVEKYLQNGSKTGSRAFTRRHFLKFSSLAFTSATVPVPLLFGGLASSSAIAKGISPQIKNINTYEYQVLNYLMEIALPITGTSLPTPEKISAMITLDQALLGTMEKHLLAELKLGIKFFNEGPKASYHGKLFTQLSPGQAVKFCDNWADSKSPQERGIVMGLKKLVALAYWSNPTTWPLLNYIGPISKRKNIPSLGNAPLPI